MAKLTHQQIADEVFAQGYELVDDSKYTSLNSNIIIRCPQGHLIETSLANFRRPSFTCPVCDKDVKFVNPTIVPKKTGFRVIAFDQATENFGLSIFDDNQLVFYSLYTFSGDVVSRLTKIKKFIAEIVLPLWQPDYVVMEDIQYQYGAVLTYKILAMLLGVIEVACNEANVKYEVVSPNVWRKYAGTAGKSRREEKMLSVALVKEKYGVKVSDDVAEAILIGRYGAMNHKPEIKMAFGKR